MLRLGPETGPVVVLALPLLEEANRTRRFAVSILRALAERGVAGALPDVPGQGDSLVRLETLSLRDMQRGFAAAVDTIGRDGRHCYAMAIRSGALVDARSIVCGRWHLAPQNGPDLLREWRRIARSASGEGGVPVEVLDPAGDGESHPADIAGNRIGPALLSDLAVTTPPGVDAAGPVRTIRLEGDPKPADRHVAGSPLWRRTEPGEDATLAALLAADIAEWIAACEG